MGGRVSRRIVSTNKRPPLRAGRSKPAPKKLVIKPSYPKTLIYTISNGIYDVLLNEHRWLLPIQKIVFGEQRRTLGDWKFINEKFSKIIPPNSKLFTVYVEGSSNLIDVEELLSETPYEAFDLVVFKSPKTNCIYEDAKLAEVIYWDVKNIIQQQINHYMVEGYPQNNGLLETNVIIRQNTNLIKNMNALWLEEAKKYPGSPDVYAFNYAVFKTNPRIKILDSTKGN